jgi:hypothetical protein
MTTPLFLQQTMPGSCGEHDLQERYGTRSRAEAFYQHQVLSYLSPPMRTFIANLPTQADTARQTLLHPPPNSDPVLSA